MNQDALGINEHVDVIPRSGKLQKLRQLVATAILGICGSTVAGAGCSSEDSKNACDRAIEKIKDCGIDPSDFEWNDPNCSSVDECAANCWLTVSCDKIIEDHNVCHEDEETWCWESDYYAFECPDNTSCCFEESSVSENVSPECHCYEGGGGYYGPNHIKFKTCEEFLASVAKNSYNSIVQVQNCP